MFATGNHDSEIFSASVAADQVTVDNYQPLGYGGLVKRLDLPKSGPAGLPVGVPLHATATSGIISLDANELSWEFQGLTGYSGGAQARWLEDTLAAWRRDGAVDFIIAFFHECAFSTCGGHSSDGGVRSTLAPLFARYQVDLAIQGHNHVYERTNPLELRPGDQHRPVGQAGGRPVPRRARRSGAREGRHHVRGRGHRGHAPLRLVRRRMRRTGTSRRAPAAARPSPATPRPGPGRTSASRTSPSGRETVDWSQARYADYGFVALDVNPAPGGQRTTMVLRYINQQGQELDRVVFSRTAGEAFPA